MPDRLFAAARVDSGWIYYVGLGVVVVVLMVAIVVFYRTWSEINEDVEADSPEDLLDSFREAHAAGEIDDRELERVRKLLAVGGGQAGGGRPSACSIPSAAEPEAPADAEIPTDIDPPEGPEAAAH